MHRFDAANSKCRISTRREGMLSAVGHDLEIDVSSYSIEIEDGPLRVRARFDASSLRVLGAVEHGRLRHDKLSQRDRDQIDRQIADEVLDSGAHPYIEFTSSEIEPDREGHLIRGELRIRGTTRSLRVAARRVPAGLEVHATIHQPDFGIKPFRALGGTLRVHPDVRVHITTPAVTPT
jgi:YceI-like domain